MGPNLLSKYVHVVNQLEFCSNISSNLMHSLKSCHKLTSQLRQQKRFSDPMPWIGYYIALASLFCILAMVADLLHGFQNRKLWFPCKYFTLNAASLSVIAVAMKLPVDLTSPMPGSVDQSAKLGSMAFMCTMMANFLPSLATMDTKELVTNIIALDVLVITLVVNVCIQINTGVVSYTFSWGHGSGNYLNYQNLHIKSIAISYVVMLLMLLIIHACSSLAILKSKQILESKYQAGREIALKDQELQQPGRLTIEKIKQHVSNYWIMAETGSPQFMTACSATTSASGVICAITTIIHICIMLLTVGSLQNYESDYKASMLVILMIQFIGVLLGTIAPLSRCFAALSFKLSIKWIWNHIKVFKIESHWTQMLSDWKDSSIPFSFRSRKRKIVIQKLIILILSFCIGFQKTVVVACKMIGLIPIFFVIFVLYCLRCWKWLKAMLIASGEKSEQHETKKYLGHYVLQLQDDMELAERTLKGISNSVDRLIKKAEMQQPYNLMKLLEGSRGFEGVEIFDSHLVPSLLLEEPVNCWSLPVVTLTSIALSLLNIKNNKTDNLLSSVSEGLVYVTLVEESLNRKDDHVRIQKAAKMLWLEVEVYHKWLGHRLQKCGPRVNTARPILEWFRDTAKNMVIEVESRDIGRSISANSMYRITETILLSYHDNIEEVSQEELFEQLSSMIGDILAACLTNLPQVITMKCDASAIEKREASVCVAARLLGETSQIINSLQDRELPRLNPEEMVLIDKWRA